MSNIKIETSTQKIAADLYTPVGIYLRMRDKFRDTILLESTDSHAGENSKSIIGINAIGGIEISSLTKAEYKYPLQATTNIALNNKSDVSAILGGFLNSFEVVGDDDKNTSIAQGLFGYTNYDAVQFFENISFNATTKINATDIPLLRYRLYQYVIVINHFKDEIYLCENKIDGLESNIKQIEHILKSKDVPEFPFAMVGNEGSDITNEDYITMVQKGIAACKRGDVFQIVLSRSFYQKYTGDDFNVYRTLRSINPGPYLFYFDYGDYKLMGSSPESQVIIDNQQVIVHPIAGTFKRTGNDEADKKLAIALENDPKENAEHTMLVDLARNDLSTICKNVTVTQLKAINYYSHVIHMVSEVQGTISTEHNPFKIMGAVFPAGTLSGAPKFKAMQLINAIEASQRNFYGGAIGYIGFDKSCNHAIMIRSMLCKNNTLHYRAGAGVVAASNPQLELEEVNHKLGALKNAIIQAQNKVSF
ncbi:anthranilate synthase component I family protein [Ferruginibacter yonginensis]|uniref:Anthranilate synthase component 1 n=1 Tax=Ferruginibacter yonginensis TaxID=1310416 RepID=A0ABV8QRS9_9BACT